MPRFDRSWLVLTALVFLGALPEAQLNAFRSTCAESGSKLYPGGSSNSPTSYSLISQSADGSVTSFWCRREGSVLEGGPEVLRGSSVDKMIGYYSLHLSISNPENPFAECPRRVDELANGPAYVEIREGSFQAGSMRLSQFKKVASRESNEPDFGPDEPLVDVWGIESFYFYVCHDGSWYSYFEH